MKTKPGRDLRGVRERMARWRKRHGGRGCRIPEELWSAAAEVARTDGAYETAQALRLDYDRLERRMAAAVARKAPSSTPGVSDFVELRMELSGAAGAVVELEGRGGERMRIQITGARTTDLVGLAQAFWSRQS